MCGGCGVAVGRHEKVTAGAVTGRALIPTARIQIPLAHHPSGVLSHQGLLPIRVEIRDTRMLVSTYTHRVA